MTEMVTGLVIGFAVGVVLLSVLMYVAVRRARQQSAQRLIAQEETIIDLRQELAEDKENNRRLRHQLHSATAAPGPAHGDDFAHFEGIEDKLALVSSERDDALLKLSEARMTLESTKSRLADREAKLAEYRAAVKQIRMSLESQENVGDIISVTQDVPTKAPVGE